MRMKSRAERKQANVDANGIAPRAASHRRADHSCSAMKF
jgi:hypothetical protein